jgi:hypothetical protein
MDDKKWVLIGLGVGAAAVALLSSFKNKEDTEGGQPTNTKGKNMNQGKTDSAENRGGASFAMFNLNPLNIKPQKKKYPGEISASGTKHSMFDSWTSGTAGAMIRLWQYMNGQVDGGAYPAGTKLNTIEKIINTWAPKYDGNDTEGYIGFVVKNTGIGRTTPLRWEQETISVLVSVMAVREDRNAARFVTDDVLLGAWAIAKKFVATNRFY